jgi:DNA-binding NarL/FixJ family response regulator
MTRHSTILLIESHPIVAEMIQDIISTNKPLYKVLTVDNPEAALAHLRRQPVHLIITNLEFTRHPDSFAFLAMLKGWNPPVPILAISEEPLHGLPPLADGITIVSQPLDLDTFLELIDKITLTAQESVLNGVSLENFLQMLEQEHKTCKLRIISGYQMGYLTLENGRLIDARIGSLRRKEAALAILGWPNCTINISESGPVESTMNLSIQSLLVEWCIAKDENETPHPPLEAA